MKKKEKITFEKARNFSIMETLNRSGHFAIKSTEKEAWFLSPFRKETDASFKVSLVLNRWYDFGIGEGGNVIDLVMRINALNPIEALHNLDDGSFSFHTKPDLIAIDEIIKILKVVDVQHYALKQYLESRCVYLYKNEINVKEIHYELKGRNYFAIAFRNNSEGYELRSKYAKLCIGKKDATLIKNGSNKLCVFEGLFDYLSFINIQNVKADFLILNSLALINRCNKIISNYESVDLYLDNDAAGDKYTNQIIEENKKANDCRNLFNGFKDLNEFLVNKKSLKKR